MACSVETIAANMVFLVELVRNGVEISVSRHGRMEGIVEHSHLRNVGHKGVYGPDTTQVARVMHVGMVDRALYALLNLGCYDTTFLKEIVSLHDTLSHVFNLFMSLLCAHL